MRPQEILDECWSRILAADNTTDVLRLREAARFAWQEKEMGGIEHVQFAFRNNTPIVPPDHCGHPTQLKKRGFIDGVGWSRNPRFAIKTFRWPDGNHFYATVNGEDVVDKYGAVKWNSEEEAVQAARAFRVM